MKNILYIILILFSFINYSYSETKKENFIQAVFASYENDSVYGGDEYYTNGLQLSFLSKNYDDNLENKYISKLLNIENKEYHNFSFGIGQKIYTPYDIENTAFVANDRPYAGYLYAFINKNIKHSNKIDTIGFSLGITGSSSFAEEVQTNIHDLIGSPKPEGWKYQLDDKPLFMLSFARLINTRENKPFKYDWNLIPKFSFNLGTPFTDVSFGVEYRYGWNLSDDLTGNKIKSTSVGFDKNKEINTNFKDLSYYLFLEATGNVVLYNTFLDSSNSDYKTDISKNYFTYEFSGGLAMNIDNYYIKYSSIYTSKEFKEQNSESFE